MTCGSERLPPRVLAVIFDREAPPLSDHPFRIRPVPHRYSLPLTTSVTLIGAPHTIELAAVTDTIFRNVFLCVNATDSTTFFGNCCCSSAEYSTEIGRFTSSVAWARSG